MRMLACETHGAGCDGHREASTCGRTAVRDGVLAGLGDGLRAIGGRGAGRAALLVRYEAEADNDDEEDGWWR